MNKNLKPKLASQCKGSFKSPVASQFKSPLNRSVETTSKLSDAARKEEIEGLKKKLLETKSQIEELEAVGYKESELQTHIDKLHEYNEIKDVGQMVLGRIADLEGVQTKDLYEKYGLGLND